MHVSTVPHLPFHKHFAQYNIFGSNPPQHLSLVLLSNVSLSSTNPGPKKGTDNFIIGGANLQLRSGDGGVCLWTSANQDCLVSLNQQTILSG